MNRIVVTGIGVISAMGDSVAENRASLIQGKCGIGMLDMFPSKFSGSLPVAEVKKNNAALKEKLNAFEKGLTRTTLLALHAFEEAIANSGLSSNQLSDFHTALVSGNTVGGMCLTDEMYEDAKKDTAGSEFIASYDYASVNMYLQQRYRLNGIINTINTACSSSANAIMYGARLIRSGRVKRAIVGGADSLAKFTINGFNALHILAPETCMPFDRNRKGLNLGEGAAFLVLERESDCPGKKIYATINGYANTNDAYHASSLSDEATGPLNAMQQALQSAKLNASDIDFINAHGTGTENNDLVEGTAMLQLFKTAPPFASTKANTGHTLGAAGAIEAVYSILSLHHQELYPGINFKEPIPAIWLEPVKTYQQKNLEHIMSNSFGFGGNCSSLIFSKP